MHVRTVGVAVLLVLSAGSAGHAKCDPAGADAADVAAARAAVIAACDCAGAASHSAYVRCARDVAKTKLVNETCVSAVVRCASRSTCGKPDAVACCRTTASGVTRATIARSASTCRAPRGGSACVSPFSSACDACTATGCAMPPPTPTPAVCGNGIVEPGEECEGSTCTESIGGVPMAGQCGVPGASDQCQCTVPNVCGNGVVDAGEQCDGATCSATLNDHLVESECGAPGTFHACECRGRQCGGCLYEGPEGELCWSSDQCLMLISPFINCTAGSCIPTTCGAPSDCGGAAGCENGLCCAPLGESYYCRIFDQIETQCCGPAVCGVGALATCCLPATEACLLSSDCCSGPCTGGVCS